MLLVTGAAVGGVHLLRDHLWAQFKPDPGLSKLLAILRIVWRSLPDLASTAASNPRWSVKPGLAWSCLCWRTSELSLCETILVPD